MVTVMKTASISSLSGASHRNLYLQVNKAALVQHAKTAAYQAGYIRGQAFNATPALHCRIETTVDHRS